MEDLVAVVVVAVVVETVVAAEGGLVFAVGDLDLDVGFVVGEEIPGVAEEVLVVEAHEMVVGPDYDAGELVLVVEIVKAEELGAEIEEELAGSEKVGPAGAVIH